MKQINWVKGIGFALCIVLFGAIAISLSSPNLHTFDTSVTQWLAARRTPMMTGLMQVFTTLCSPVALLLICLALMFLYRKKQYSIPVAVNLIVSVSLNHTLKNLFLRERPPLAFRAIWETGYSFPSGHAMAAAAFYGFLIYLVAQSHLHKTAKRGLVALLALLIAAIGFSRVYLGVHYLSDVVAGIALSTAYLLVYTSIVAAYVRAGQKAGLPTVRPYQNKSMWHSFAHAFDGIAGGLKDERNMIIHFAAMALVTVFGFLLHISKMEWLVCILLFGLVIGMELINTAIETTVDICMPHQDPRARLAKDTAAGAVLIVSVAAAVAGAIIFLPKMLATLF